MHEHPSSVSESGEGRRLHAALTAPLAPQPLAELPPPFCWLPFAQRHRVQMSGQDEAPIQRAGYSVYSGLFTHNFPEKSQRFLSGPSCAPGSTTVATDLLYRASWWYVRAEELQSRTRFAIVCGPPPGPRGVPGWVAPAPRHTHTHTSCGISWGPRGSSWVPAAPNGKLPSRLLEYPTVAAPV
jgi:hypothetical protein